MKNANDNIDALIAKQLAGEILPAEKTALETWLAISADNLLYFKQMEQVWQHAEKAKQPLPHELDVETALLRTKTKISQQTQGTQLRLSFRRSRLAVAAALTLAIAALWFFQQNRPAASVTLAATDTAIQDSLSDGSKIALNRQSSLSATFNQHQRMVKMKGEAFFQVAPDKEKPFVIAIREVSVTVVGTRFNIDNLSDSTLIIISVEEGRVKVQSGDQVLYLNAGEAASIDCRSGQIIREKAPALEHIKGWFDHRFVFDDVPLAEVVSVLEDAYNTTIELRNKELGNCRLRARFNDEPIERVMQVIAETFSLQLTNKNGQFQLDGAGCGQ